MGSNLSHWDGKIKRRPLADFTLDAHFSAVCLDDVFDNGQTQTGPSSFAGTRPVGAKESFKDPFARGRWDTGAVVFDPNFVTRVLRFTGADFDAAIGTAILNGVFDQVEKY